MGKDPDPWQLRHLNRAGNVKAPPAPAKLAANTMLQPNYSDLYGFFNLNSHFTPPNPTTEFATGQKRFIIFDQSKEQLATQFLNPNPRSNETNVSDVNVHEEEMHEDTEEIDALLYSDSETKYDEEEEEEEASTGHSPIENTAENSVNRDKGEDEVLLQTPKPLLSKRHRFEYEVDTRLEDTASSTHCNFDEGEKRKRVKREKIQETVGVLRRIIPGGKGKDAASVLDEAIKYLKSLRLKAKGLGAAALK